MSKGSGRRPSEVDLETFNKNWENIFGRNNRNNKPSQSHSIHSGECKRLLDSQGEQDRVGTPTEDSKSNTDERRVGKRSLKGSLRTQP